MTIRDLWREATPRDRRDLIALALCTPAMLLMFRWLWIMLP